jgi:hypothetical protein
MHRGIQDTSDGRSATGPRLVRWAIQVNVLPIVISFSCGPPREMRRTISC